MVVSVNRTALNGVCEEYLRSTQGVFSVPLPFPGPCACRRQRGTIGTCSESIGKSSSQRTLLLWMDRLASPQLPLKTNRLRGDRTGRRGTAAVQVIAQIWDPRLKQVSEGTRSCCTSLHEIVFSQDPLGGWRCNKRKNRFDRRRCLRCVPRPSCFLRDEGPEISSASFLGPGVAYLGG